MSNHVPLLNNPTNLLFRRHISHLSSPLRPLLSLTTGLPHPSFPKTILNYHILTSEQLDELAHFYHQRTPSALSFQYPAPVIARWARDADINDKRRRFGRFLGLRGCESPVSENEMQRAEQDVIDRWVEERIREGVERERRLESWRTKRW